MTKDEIIKALGCCAKDKSCIFCPLHEINSIFCMDNLCTAALDHIESQQAEIKSLKERLDIADEETQLAHKANMTYIIEAEKSKAKALKRLADAIRLEFYREYDELIPSIMSDKIDELVKEFIGIDGTEEKSK